MFIYDNEDILLELDGSNNITARYTHGPGIDEPLIMEKAGASFFYHADGLGSITVITNQSGGVAQQYTYCSFGKIESQLDPTLVQPYTFTAREFDPETGLYYYRARYYDPNTGRFNGEDPLFASRPFPSTKPESSHLYAYVVNSPVTLTDPSGLGPCEDAAAPCFRAARDRLFQCRKNVFQLAVACATGCIPLCLAAGPGYGQCFAICEAGCAAGGVAGLTACSAIAAAERFQCARQYLNCKKARCEPFLPLSLE